LVTKAKLIQFEEEIKELNPQGAVIKAAQKAE